MEHHCLETSADLDAATAELLKQYDGNINNEDDAGSHGIIVVSEKEEEDESNQRRTRLLLKGAIAVGVLLVAAVLGLTFTMISTTLTEAVTHHATQHLDDGGIVLNDGTTIIATSAADRIIAVPGVQEVTDNDSSMEATPLKTTTRGLELSGPEAYDIRCQAWIELADQDLISRLYSYSASCVIDCEGLLGCPCICWRWAGEIIPDDFVVPDDFVPYQYDDDTSTDSPTPTSAPSVSASPSTSSEPSTTTSPSSEPTSAPVPPVPSNSWKGRPHRGRNNQKGNGVFP